MCDRHHDSAVDWSDLSDVPVMKKTTKKTIMQNNEEEKGQKINQKK